MEIESLIRAAANARRLAYAPYSGFAVGAALSTKDGAIFSGCNVENISFGLTICAERTAIFKAVSEGYREFPDLVIVADANEPVSPCGACRQVASEFTELLRITSVTVSGRSISWTIGELLPRPKSGILDVPRGTI
jgi:cytidine deaminase